MAFDPNSVPKDMRPMNIARPVPEDPRIAPVTSSVRPIEGFYANPPRDARANPDSVPPVYYTSTISDAGFIPMGYNNAVPGAAGCVLRGVPPQCQLGAMGASALRSVSGSSNSPKFGTQVVGSASDHTSDEGGDGSVSVSGRKVKFLCSFGGKILPRPSDGALRYVGGQTRIISVRRDVGFGELVQKMADTYGQNVVIKYQLPDEDLDALVSVSCPDDLENMMDEYEKLVERSSDGSAKLRVFLFSPSELGSASLLHIGDSQDGGQRYVEAVNGILNGFGGGARIARKESFESAASAQNSDLSGTEGADNFGHGHGEVTGPLSTGGFSPGGNPGVSLETAPGTVSADHSAVHADPSATRLGIPVAKSGPATTMAAVSELDRYVPLNVPQSQMGFDLQQPGVSFPASSSYVQAYMDPHQENLNHAEYVQLPSQMGFPAQIYGAVGPVFTQQHSPAGASSQQFIPAVNMTMNPSTISMKPIAVPAIVQPQRVNLEHYPAESTLPQRVPADKGYILQHAQVPITVPGGMYGWHQVPHLEQVAFSEGGLPSQPVMVSEKIPRFDDCYMCQKALPHAHSDPMAQDQKGSPASTLSDTRSIYSSMPLDDKGQPMIKPVLSGTQTESITEQLAAGARPRIMGYVDHEAGKVQADRIGISQNLEGAYANDKTILRKAQNPEYFKVSTPQGLMMTSSAQSEHGVFMGNIPQASQDSFQQIFASPQYQVVEGSALNMPVNNDLAPVGGMPLQTSDYITHESPKDYSGIVAGSIPKEDATSSVCDQLRQIDKRLENLQVCPSEVLANNELGKPVADPRKEDILENRLQQVSGREFPKMHNFPPTESYELTEPPLLGNPNSYLQSKLGIDNLASGEISSRNPRVESTHPAERIPPTSEWRDRTLWSQTRIPADLESVAQEENGQSSVDPTYGDMPDNSNSLFSNQDPWSLHHDTPFPPPRPSKIQIRKEAGVTRDPPGDNHPMNIGELQTDNCKELRIELPLDDVANLSSENLNGGLRSEHVMSDKGSAEDLIKQELQAVAEGVAASVLHSSVPSNPEPSDARSEFLSTTLQNGVVQNTDTEMEHSEKYEDLKTKIPEKINFGFPVSDSIGRLQIIKNNDLEELRELGSGTFGTVYHGKWRGTDVAIKRINDRCFAGKPSEQDRMREDFWNEAIKLADLHHPNVVAFYGIVPDGPSGSIATVTEYMVNGSLRKALQKSDRNLDKRKRLLITMDVAFGMEYLHGKNIVHFDLKSDNLLVNLRDPHRPICKVGDLGLSKVKCHTLISGGVRGTLPWMAPELLNGSSSLVSEKVDVFSFGIVMWELLTGEEPYTDLHYGAIIGGIVSNTLRPPVPESCDPDWRQLMEWCWSAEPSERPSFTEVADDLRAMAAKLPPKGQV